MHTFEKPLVNKNTTLAYFQGQIAEQKRLLNAVRHALPENLAAQVRHCVIKETVLVLYSDSCAWASLLRFYQPKIIDKLAAAVPFVIKEVQVKLLKEVTGILPVQTARKAKLPTLESIETLRKDSLTVQDEALQTALLKLTNTLTRLKVGD